MTHILYQLNAFLFQSFGVAPSGLNSHFTSGFGEKGLKRRPTYIQDSEEETGASYEVNYKTTVTHKPVFSSFDFGTYKSTDAPAPAPAPSKTKFGSNGKFGSSYGHQAAPSSGLFKFNEPGQPGQITTKFQISHPAPSGSEFSADNSYHHALADESSSSSGHLTDKFISDYHSALHKLKNDQHKSVKQPAKKFENPFKTKFQDNSNFKVSTGFKVAPAQPSSSSSLGEEFYESGGAPTHQQQFHRAPQEPLKQSESFDFGPHFKLQEVPNLYPSGDDQFKPSVGVSGQHHQGAPHLFAPSNSEKEELVKQQFAPNPASKGQYQQFLKAQQDEKIEQQALLEQLKYQQQKGRPSYGGSATKFKPYIPVKQITYRRKPVSRIVSPGLGHYRTPIIDGPYTIHFSV